MKESEAALLRLHHWLEHFGIYVLVGLAFLSGWLGLGEDGLRWTLRGCADGFILLDCWAFGRNAFKRL